MAAMFLCNRCPSRAISLDKSPHQIWTSKRPLLGNLKVLGCHAYVTIPKEKRTKFDASSIRCRFIGYSDHEKAYRFEELDSGRVLVSRDAQFMENVFDGGKHNDAPEEAPIDLQDDEEATDEDSQQEKEEETARDEDMDSGSKRHQRTQSLEKAAQVPRAKRSIDYKRHQGLNEMSATAQECPSYEAAYIMDSVGEMPITVKSAMESDDASKERKACDSEFESLNKNETWELVPLPCGRKAISSKWVFKMKETVEGFVKRYKARLVARGFLQKYGVDFEETFSQVAKFKSIRIILSLAAQ
ncbi:unnamed protein product [Peronospora belbahrii]|uniref:Reverse transcriptase Ty1/copia-type domain-containing protein n=1 Tax=Peronospora belbahrii TaxID=622444 RepID=A0ABN8CX48_9STRA|nr:unnamed protein product [Peronospora belbahrii]